MPTKFSKEEILDAYNSAPELVRATYNSSRTYVVVLEIQKKYNLHVDVAGIISQEINYLLLGLTNPNTFIQRIQQEGVDVSVANNIVQDVNSEIFIPLQKRIRDNVVINEEAPKSDWSEIDLNNLLNESKFNQHLNTPLERLRMEQARPVQPQATPTLQNTSPQSTNFSQPGQATPQPLAPTQIPHRTMQQDMALVQQGNLHDAKLGVMPIPSAPTYTASAVAPTATYAAQPQSLASAPCVPPTPTPAWHASPAASFQTASIPNTASTQPIEHIPASVPSPVFTPPAQPFQPAQTSEAQQPSQHFAPLTKQYGSDPYREVA